MVKHLPWLEIQVVRAIMATPKARFGDLKEHFAPEWREDEVADAVAYLVNQGIIRLGRNGFTAFQ